MNVKRHASFLLSAATCFALAVALVAPVSAQEAPAASVGAEGAPPSTVPEPPPQEASALPFLVTLQSVQGAVLLNFPWTERTAAAVFQRQNAIWIVFSGEAWVNAARLSTVLPSSIRGIVQYRLAGATVLRLATDGTVFASAEAVPQSYAWNIRVSSQPPKPTQDVPVTVVQDAGKPQLQISAYDVSPPLRFYDPVLQDQLVVVPSYQAGEGVMLDRLYAGLHLLDSPQGIALVVDREDMQVEPTRAGVLLSSTYPLPVSDRLPLLSSRSAPLVGISSAAHVMMPYDRWFIPKNVFVKERQLRTRNLANATPDAIPDALARLMQLYLGRGMFHEALGYLNLLLGTYPDYYAEQKLALLRGACHVLIGRVADAKFDLSAKELDGMREAELWRSLSDSLVHPRSLIERIRGEDILPAQTDERGGIKSQKDVISLLGTSGHLEPVLNADSSLRLSSQGAPMFDYLDYEEDYIRYYPPVVRQRLAILGADSYLLHRQESNALKVYDGLSRDGILKPIQMHAEYALARVAASKNKIDEALEIYDRLGQQLQDPYIRARAKVAGAVLRYKQERISPEATAAVLESVRPAWVGGIFERQNLYILGKIYRDSRHYADAIRTWKYMLEAFPDDPEVLTLSGDMTELFKNIFLHDMGKEMSPLSSLALFYEFRELTPVGTDGDLMIQKLADRLAAVDLLSRAAQLLEHQVRNRLTGEDRARVGARLALLYLLNHEPAKALQAIESSAFAGSGAHLLEQRAQITAQALNALGNYENALSVLFQDKSEVGEALRLEILWTMKDWPNVINQAEDMLAARPNLTAKLSDAEVEVLLRLALAYSFEGDSTQLRYLRDYYGALIPPSHYKEIFEFLTNDTAPLDTEDQALITQQITHTRGFLEKFRAQIAQGKLSEAVK